MSNDGVEDAKEKARQEIARLIEKYRNLSDTDKKRYTEAQTRRVFIEPLFSALGWDIYGGEEVVEEVKAVVGRVDYVFKLRGVSQFYLEAKPLRAELTKSEYIKQAVTYAYNKGITWAVLTNFEGIQVYNAQTGRSFINITYDSYLRDFDDLWLLSRESLEQNALNARAEKYGALPLRLGIEQRLFNQLRQWREALFTQLHHYNQKLNYTQIDEVIQRLFNRFIFIRTCEDRKIEDRILLSAVHEWRSSSRKGELVEIIRRIFRDFDGYYDSDLFASHITDNVFIESTTLENIINGLYEIPGGMANYDFSLIGADVLGTVYEQYLGHIATVVKQRAKEVQAKMDLGFPAETTFELTAKKQRRKEQGIYYTPRFVTDYIVKETVGRFLKERSHNEIVNIKILDPACGSGSFLIRAYDELLNYHADKHGKPVSQLDQWERLPILTGNIYGVDLDMQAIEIARLNLLLRSLAKRDTLPTLADTIRQGNSLISGTEDKLKKYFGKKWRERKPFNWGQEFSDIMAKGGFDIVIGNPPYGAEFNEADRAYIQDFYPNSKDNKNSAAVFIEKGLTLTKEGGFFGFIIPKSLAYSQKWANTRRLILNRLGAACDVSKAFREVLLEQMIIVISQKFSKQTCYQGITLGISGRKDILPISKETSAITDSILMGINEQELKILYKLSSSKHFMSHISRTSRGLPFQKYVTQDPNGIPVYRGDHIARYNLYETKETLSEDVLKSRADKKISFLRQPKIISQRIIAHVLHPTDHIIIMSTFDKDGIITVDTVENTVLTDKKFSYSYITGLLNSKLWSWYAYRFIFSKAIRTMDLDEYYVAKFPIPFISFSNPIKKKMHDNLVALVEKMLKLNKRLAPIRNTPCNEHDQLLREINHVDREIDNLVYDLYGLTEEERKIVEENG